MNNENAEPLEDSPLQQQKSDFSVSDKQLLLSPQLEQRYAASLAQSSGATLDLTGLGLDQLPPLEELGRRFSKLRQLNIRRNALASLPEGLARAFPQLTALNASENSLEELTASSVGSLRNLQRLDVSHNRLRELPASTFERLDALEELDARGNQLETICFDTVDAKLLGLHKLQVLLLADNRLRSIEATTVEMLPKLRVLDLSGNPELQDVPDKLRRLHERNVLLHSRAKRRELIVRALSVRKAVAQALAATPTTSVTKSKQG